MISKAQAILNMAELLPLLNRAGHGIVGADGLDDGTGQLTLKTPAGQFIEVQVNAELPLRPRAAAAQAAIRAALRPFEGEAGRGFFGSRGVFAVGERGYSAEEGLV